YRSAFIRPGATFLGPKFRFARHGRSGAELSELLPHLASCADDIAIVKSMATDAFNHAPAQIMMNTGSQQFGRPSLGSWSLYGLRDLNTRRLGAVGDPEISARVSSFEMAYRMQASAPDLMDLASEPRHVLQMYGAEPGRPSFANNCLLARRLVEKGVRFVQLFHESWDQHGGLVRDLRKNCGDTDRPCAALIKDLKRLGLLDDTLVVWGGEFGRTPMVQG